jgi:RNase P subunit RPR2
MKTKICATCNEPHVVLYRVQINLGKEWLFCCKNCTEKHQSLPYYKYGGTWKGSAKN